MLKSIVFSIITGTLPALVAGELSVETIFTTNLNPTKRIDLRKYNVNIMVKDRKAAFLSGEKRVFELFESIGKAPEFKEYKEYTYFRLDLDGQRTLVYYEAEIVDSRSNSRQYSAIGFESFNVLKDTFRNFFDDPFDDLMTSNGSLFEGPPEEPSNVIRKALLTTADPTHKPPLEESHVKSHSMHTDINRMLRIAGGGESC